MKPKYSRIFHFATASTLVALFSMSAQLRAQSTWTGAPNGEWGTASNWTGGVPNAIGAVANINTALTVNVSDTGTGGTYPYTFGTLATSLANGSVTLGNNGTTTDILTAATSSGVPVINVANSSGIIFFYANLEGTQGFQKTGAGKLTFRYNGANQNYTGNITISAGILGIDRNGSLGNDNNDIVIADGARLLAEPGTNSGTITLPSTRTITLTGAQSQIGSSNVNINLVIEGNITEDAAGKGLSKTDAGKVTLSGAISYTGDTRIAGGTLAIAGSAALPSTKALRFTGNSVNTFDLGGTTQTVGALLLDTYYIHNRIITNGNLSVVGNADLRLGGGIGTTHDFTGLTSFSYDGTGAVDRDFILNQGGATAGVVQLDLAKTGTGNNLIKVDQVQIGTGAGVDGVGTLATLRLGKINTIEADSMQIGGYRSSGTVNFNAGITSGTLKIRAEDGVSAMGTLVVGSQSSGSSTRTGILDLTGGSLDAKVNNLVIGLRSAGAPIAVMTMPAGTLEATNMLIGDMIGAGYTGTITSTFNQSGGTAKAANLIFGRENSEGSTPNFQSTLNLSGGSLLAGNIQAGSGTFSASSVRKIAWTGGIIGNLDTSTDLTVNGVSGTGGSIIIDASTTTAKFFMADTNRTVTLGANTTLTGSGAISKAGDGALVISGASSAYTGTIAVDAGTLGGTTTLGGNVAIGASGTLSPTAQANGSKLTVVNATFTAGSIFDWDLTTADKSDPGAATSNFGNYGQLAATSASGSSVFNVTLLGGGTGTDSYADAFWNTNKTWTNVFAATGLTDLTSLFSSFSGDGLVASGSGSSIIGTAGGEGHFSFSSTSLNWTAVPEPTTALAGLLLGAGLLRRRRQ